MRSKIAELTVSILHSHTIIKYSFMLLINHIKFTWALEKLKGNLAYLATGIARMHVVL